MVDIVICDSPPILALVVGDGFIFVVAGLGIQGNDIPGVNKSRKIAKHAEQDVNERIRTADS